MIYILILFFLILICSNIHENFAVNIVAVKNELYTKIIHDNGVIRVIANKHIPRHTILYTLDSNVIFVKKQKLFKYLSIYHYNLLDEYYFRAINVDGEKGYLIYKNSNHYSLVRFALYSEQSNLDIINKSNGTIMFKSNQEINYNQTLTIHYDKFNRLHHLTFNKKNIEHQKITQIISNIKSTMLLELKKSNIINAGIGVFSRELIDKNTLLMCDTKPRGTIHESKISKLLDKNEVDLLRKYSTIEGDKYEINNDYTYVSDSDFLNHDINSKYLIEKTIDGNQCYVTNKDIHKNEEILIDYKTWGNDNNI